ncbi:MULTISPECIES: heat-inducible transcriptional repressor HrcA [Stappiaceae]|uniref:Heat-inducible transcription repressor HrcA n=1 Tax=Roseibium aggregatum (strain ATCC 25650 / DSM 13394 / JCM 20685 / NBRC 16684 / NCIMB 2208 / IAM 12614 / B1) TaxID=384765 RepID=A0P3N2_ROSAI|nr:heat-inducible transcriptional repressor HrcA [Roseibium aggregatum]EAV40388.1 heat-inducible transcription repressor [Stappia aggregata IAM 12614] [Roseibium aggregatum IAM 12614]
MVTFGEQALSLSDLDKRSREIFRSIVETYLETGEPVGSRNVSRKLGISLSPASVRNVMSDLEHLGLLHSPHTSAGRLPTEIGLRFFVDALLEVGDLTQDERRAIDAQVRASQKANSAEQVLTEASQMLSGLSMGAGVVLTHKSDMRLKHIEFVRIEPLKALAILVSEDGSVENRVVDLPGDLPSSALVEASNYLNAQIKGRTLSEIRSELERVRDADQAELDLLSQKVIDAGLAVWGGESATDPGTLIVRGRSNLLTDLDAVEDLERIRLLFDDLESKKDLIQLLGLAEKGDGVRIFIGSENNLFSLSGSSLVVSPYRDSNQRIVGVLGVIGPTRLNYARVIPMVDYTARLVSRILG